MALASNPNNLVRNDSGYRFWSSHAMEATGMRSVPGRISLMKSREATELDPRICLRR